MALRASFGLDLGTRDSIWIGARRGFPEVVYGAGKTVEQLVEIGRSLTDTHPNVLCTRVDEEAGAVLCREVPALTYDAVARVAYAHRDPSVSGLGPVGVVAAGTSDAPVAREAELCARVMGNEVHAWTDVGVAGLHRLLGVLDDVRAMRVVISVAGMEAALPSVLAGLLSRPVVSVPTSVGYGANFGAGGAAVVAHRLRAGGGHDEHRQRLQGRRGVDESTLTVRGWASAPGRAAANLS